MAVYRSPERVGGGLLLTNKGEKGQEMETKEQTLWEMFENPPAYAGHTTALWEWSRNFDAGRTPATIFLDLIGYSADQYGAPLFNYSEIQCALGYLELNYLGDALKEYAERPSDVMAWVEKLLEAEMKE